MGLQSPQQVAMQQQQQQQVQQQQLQHQLSNTSPVGPDGDHLVSVDGKRFPFNIYLPKPL